MLIGEIMRNGEMRRKAALEKTRRKPAGFAFAR